MSLKAIVLWKPKATLTSDEACTTILQYSLPPHPSATCTPYQPHHNAETNSLSYVPPLEYFCVRSCLEYPEQIHTLGPARLRYRPPTDERDFDILQALIPAYRPFSNPGHDEFDLCVVDPRLWAVIAQVYEGLPAVFREYALPLSDTHLPLLQMIPSTQHFSLITVLSLTRCNDLTDDTVVELRHLHTLTALDASITALGSWGVQRLAKCLAWSEGDEAEDRPPERRGPWGLRVLYLRDCINVGDEVLLWLPRFPLLSVVDLRGTTCKPWQHFNSPFKASLDRRLFNSSALSEVLAHLSSLMRKPHTLFSHFAPYVLKVDSLYHKADPTPMQRRWTTAWGTSGPDTRPEQKTGLQVASGRMDVFLPYKAPREEHDPYISSGGTCDAMGCNCDLPISSRAHDGSSGGAGYGEEDEGEDRGEDDLVTGSEDDKLEPVPSDMSEDGFREGPILRSSMLEPQPPEDSSWMDEVAEHESVLYRRQRAVDIFYAVPPPRQPLSLSSWTSSDPSGRPQQATASADPLMLFRTPPPWSTLPLSPPGRPASSKMPTSVFSSSNTPNYTTSPSGSPRKRKLADDAAPADQARKRMHALTSIQNMFAMVQKRQVTQNDKTTSSCRDSSSRSVPPQAKVNPFTRNALPMSPVPKSKVRTTLKFSNSTQSTVVESARPPQTAKATIMPAGPKSWPKPASATSSAIATTTSIPRLNITKRPHQSLTGHTGKADLPRPVKQLRPISTLRVPDLPPNNMKALSAHQPKPPLDLLKAKQDAWSAHKQTTLSVSVSTDASRERGGGKAPSSADGKTKVVKADRRVSASIAVTNRLNMTTVGKVGKEQIKVAVVKPKGMSEKDKESRRTSGGQSFDWKRWSGG